LLQGLFGKKKGKRNPMGYKYCFLDLDGTIVDSSPSITQSVQYALEKMGIEPPPVEELTCFIGPPLVDSFSKYFGLSHEDSVKATAYYREIYRAGNIFKCNVYDGIIDLLEALNRANIPCVLATCKPHEFANRILEYHNLSKYFTFVSGPEMDGTRNEKHEVITHAAEHLGITDLSEILMVGDHTNDVNGARYHKIHCAGVRWGFGSDEELLGAGATYLCDTPADIAKLFGIESL
jgi:phosphoglycolate phosphatase